MFEVQMPQAGQSMEEGTIVRWLKSEGDRVQAKDVLFEVETDKAVVEVEAGHDGILRKIIVPVGQLVPIRTKVGLIGEANEPIPADVGGAVSPVPVAVPVSGGAMIEVRMPQAGKSMETVTISRWLKQEGDRVQASDVLLVGETERSLVEVEAGHDGVLRKIVVPAGKTVSPRMCIALIGDASAVVADVPVGGVSPKVSVAVPPGGPIKASPAARKLAGERGIDLASVGSGSGPHGRITSRDIPVQAVPAKTTAQDGVLRRGLKPMRKAIARNLQISKQTIPHFYMQLTLDAGPMVTLQKAEKEKYPCSINDFVTRACAMAIREFPAFRSRMENDEMLEFDDVNIGIAVGMDEGLLVPVILGADKRSVKDLAAETRRLVQAAKAGKIEGMGKGVFTITNLGMFGIEQFSAIVNPPESAILAVGAAREAVVVQNGAMAIGKVMTMTLSADHRVVDGLLAAKFMGRLKALLESPEALG